MSPAMSQADDALRLWSESASAWIDSVQRGDINRTELLDAAVLSMCGHVRGRQVLDLGCGEGRFKRILGKHGARCVGLDPTVELLASARGDNSRARLVRGTGEELPFRSSTFDIVVCYLTLLDIEQYRSAVMEISRVLRPRGRLVIANLQSYATCRPEMWVRNERGEKDHVAFDDYFEERPVTMEWSNIRIVNFHRPMEAYMRALLGSGLNLLEFREPRPTPQSVEKYPSLADERRVPRFYVMSWEKA